MYDLKQTANGQASDFAEDNDKFHEFLTTFVKQGWNTSMLDKFYKVPEPLGIRQLFIPQISADDAPKAFKAEKKVRPQRWVIIYRGKFSAPKSGTFRFAGFCDDILVVRLNGKNVLDGSIADTSGDDRLREKLGLTWAGVDETKYNVRGGTWFELKQGLTYNIEILIGEQPGGMFCAYLFVQEKGVSYEQPNKTLTPQLPVFQTTAERIPPGRSPKIASEQFVGSD
jgi:hypothetical protein